MTFNAQEVLDATGPQSLTAGWQTITVQGLRKKISGAGNEYLAIEYRADAGSVWVNFNLNHPNAKADQMAQRELARLMIACKCNSVKDPMNPQELIGKQCMVELEADGSFFKVISYKPLAQTPAQPIPTDDRPEDDIPF